MRREKLNVPALCAALGIVYEPTPRQAAVYAARLGPDVGYGLFADAALAPGDVIGEYAGELSSDWKPLCEGGRFNPYLLRYPRGCSLAIDAEKRGNEQRFVNHSSRPNAGRRYALRAGVLRVLFVAERPIARDEQILLDYGADYWRGRQPAALRP